MNHIFKKSKNPINIFFKKNECIYILINFGI